MKQSKEVRKTLAALRRDMAADLLGAYRGWFQWKKINLTEGIGNTEVILFPSDHTELNYLALLYLDEYLKKIKRDNAILLTFDERVVKSAYLFSKKILKVQKFNRRSAKNLMQLYCLYKFTHNLTIISLDEPYGRNAHMVVGKNGTALEDVFKICIYAIWPEQPAVPVQYRGKDEEIKNFIELGNSTLRREDCP